MSVNVTGDSPETVAYALMHDILASEGVVLVKGSTNSIGRADLLTLYAECLATVRSDKPVSPARAVRSNHMAR